MGDFFTAQLGRYKKQIQQNFSAEKTGAKSTQQNFSTTDFASSVSGGRLELPFSIAVPKEFFCEDGPSVSTNCVLHTSCHRVHAHIVAGWLLPKQEHMRMGRKQPDGPKRPVAVA